MIIWNNGIVSNPCIPCPLDYGCYEDEDRSIKPVMTNNPPAHEAIINLVKCGCAKSKCTTTHCSCANAIPPLPCTDLCGYSDDYENKEKEPDTIEKE